LVGGDVTFTDYRRIATNQQDSAGETLRPYYDAAIKREFDACRRLPADDLLFRGLFRTYRSADEYHADFKQLLPALAQPTSRSALASEKIMPDILHRVGIQASAEKVYWALTDEEGLAGWWTRKVEAPLESDQLLNSGSTTRALTT
jgi:hypothetical protein